MNAYFLLILMIVFVSVLIEKHIHKIRMERISNYMPKITIYSKNNCVKCRMTKKFFKENNINFLEINIDDEEFNLKEYNKTRDEFIKYIKDELLLSTMPIVVTENSYWGDYQLNELKELAKNPKYKV